MLDAAHAACPALVEDVDCPACGKTCNSRHGYSSCCNADFMSPDKLKFRPGTRKALAPKIRGSKSAYRGVCERHPRPGQTERRFRVTLMAYRKQWYVCECCNEIQAARLYDNAAFYAHQDGHLRAFPLLNFPAQVEGGVFLDEKMPSSDNLLAKLAAHRGLLDLGGQAETCRSPVSGKPSLVTFYPQP